MCKFLFHTHPDECIQQLPMKGGELPKEVANVGRSNRSHNHRSYVPNNKTQMK